MRWRWGRENLDDDLSSTRIVEAETQYERALGSAILFSALLGLLLVVVHGAVAWLSQAGAMAGTETTAATTIAIALPGSDHLDGGAALAVLLPVAIALQVLLRMPGDMQTTDLGDVVARRQFWGPVGTLVAAASAYVAIATFVRAFLMSHEVGIMDFIAMFGIPLGAGVTLVIAADAAAVAQSEAERFRLLGARAQRAVEVRKKALKLLRGEVRARPLVSLWVEGGIAAVLVTGAGCVLAWTLFPAPRPVVVYAIVSLALTILLTAAIVQFLPSALRGSPVVGLFGLLAVSSVSAVFVGMLVVVAMQSVEPLDDPWAYVPSMVYGVAALIPSFATVAVVGLPRSDHRRMAPLLAVARQQLVKEVDRIQDAEESPKTRDTSEVFARATIATSIIPVIAIVLACLAMWHGRGRARTATMRCAIWLPVAFAAVEIAAVVFLPVYGAAWGLFTVP